ncbi:hypothetical protein KAM448_05400 [Aeromonas caviae]|uniref:Uncharacterized protein n=1 Tax=Aeromonas caviae TaxID=648 RepID=A0ABD0B8H7_AERCA|nr:MULTISPECIES: hypothetical protein [Aeromonas]EZH76617.1 hypothetical protein AT59_05065 [Aeromonas hydrophila AD9]BCR29930.1 hypothetical protein KAM376_29360 [Aeromonas caviae]GJA81037.1 hypothetical protein KAM355_15970 [Aeromonas caviae]GJA98484.1 hypothetical protein KAM359_18920 [Aeromonas caviae]GJB10754.1 hypothetical protein KAM362_13140 [Aeromonas caviae]
MKRVNAWLGATVLLTSGVSVADEWASMAITPGVGRLEVVSNYLIFSSSKDYEVQIPNKIPDGRQIQMRYKKDGDWITGSFFVAGISTKGDLCRLHSELPSRFSSSASDTIYVKSCRYK